MKLNYLPTRWESNQLPALKLTFFCLEIAATTPAPIGRRIRVSLPPIGPAPPELSQAVGDVTSYLPRQLCYERDMVQSSGMLGRFRPAPPRPAVC